MASPDALVIGLLGGGILLLGAAVSTGRLWLLANYRPGAVEVEERVARLAGGLVVAFGLLTLALSWGLASGRAGDWWWAGWAVAALGIAVGVAGVASGRR